MKYSYANRMMSLRMPSLGEMNAIWHCKVHVKKTSANRVPFPQCYLYGMNLVTCRLHDALLHGWPVGIFSLYHKQSSRRAYWEWCHLWHSCGPHVSTIEKCWALRTWGCASSPPAFAVTSKFGWCYTAETTHKNSTGNAEILTSTLHAPGQLVGQVTKLLSSALWHQASEVCMFTPFLDETEFTAAIALAVAFQRHVQLSQTVLTPISHLGGK